MALDPVRCARGALAGAVAAGVWVAQQPLDIRVFGVPYRDHELLGKAVTRGPGWRRTGIAMHLANGALFGAVYAHLRATRAIPGPDRTRGLVAGMAEHAASWPLVGVADRFHPARRELPTLGGDRAALAQATWRHLLFGAVLGEVERALNPPVPEPGTPPAEAISGNGHGNLEHAVIVATD